MKKKSMKKWWGFNTKEMDVKGRIQNDFFQYANGGWLKKNPIPNHESRWGAFMELRHKTDKQLKQILKEISSKKRAVKGSEGQIIRDFYNSGINMNYRNKLNYSPINPYVEMIEKISSKKDLVGIFAHFSRVGITTPWSSFVTQDMKKSSVNVLYISQDGLGMPDRDYYLKRDKNIKKTRDAYQKHIVSLFKLLGYSQKQAKENKKTVMNIEKKLAMYSMDKVESRNMEKIYNKKTLRELKTISQTVDWKNYFEILGTPKFSYLIVEQPKFIKKVNLLINSVSTSDWKTYLKWHLINDTASALSQPFVDQSFSFYGKTLLGNKEMRPLWQRILNTVNGNVGEALGKLYVKRFFGPQAKKKMNVLIDDLFDAYEERLKKLDWMSPKTKQKALNKLHKMNRKVGYPDRWKSYRGLNIQKDDYLGNIIRSYTFKHKKNMKKLGKPVDRKEWHMYPQTVNAYYSFTMNEIVFPAAILQHPFFDVNSDDAINYGGIGSVIGHEITHGFDDQGSKFDGNGNLKSWWTKDDRRRFTHKAKILSKQFNKYTVAPKVHVNGEFTLGENIADLGGLFIGFYAYQKRLAKNKRKNIEGFTPEQRFFLGLAQIEREHSRKEHLKNMVKVDPHSPAKFRINGPVSNSREFYEAFGVTKKDKLYRDTKNRAEIW